MASRRSFHARVRWPPVSSSETSGPYALNNASAAANSPLELLLWTHRHTSKDLEEIHYHLTGHPGTTPVILHFQNSAGKRLSIEPSQTYHIKRSEELLNALDRFME